MNQVRLGLLGAFVALGLAVACSSAGGGAASGSVSVGDGGAESAVDAGPPGPPQIERMAYYTGERGPRLLIRGVDREPNDLLTVRLEFLDAAGAPVLVDLGSGTADTSELLVNAMATLEGGHFLVELQSAPGFDAQVKAIAATPRGRPGKGARRTANLSSPPQRALAEACDVVFDACAVGGVCAPAPAMGGSGGGDVCLDAADARRKRCDGAAHIAIGESIVGRTQDVSFWEPPQGCVSAEARKGPEGVVMLHVATATPALFLTTDAPETDFDTVIYVFSGCGGDARESLACNDDDAAPRSLVELRDVAPGDYLVVVDAIGPRGGTFRLSASTSR